MALAVRPRLRRVVATLTWVDLAVVAALALVGAVRRRGMLPATGLWFDDSWVAAAGVLGSPGDILLVGSSNPSFVLLLMAIDGAGGGIGALALPAMVGAVLTAPALYLLARRCGFPVAAVALPASVLAVARLPLLYSGRVKVYALEPLVVVVVAGLVAIFARVRWRARTAVLWVAVAWVVGGFGVAALVATGAAAAILVLHPVRDPATQRDDRLVRIAAGAAQAAGQVLYLLQARSRFDSSSIEEATIDDNYDGYLDLGGGPRAIAGELLEHLARVGELAIDRSGLAGAAVVVVGLAGLLASAGWGRARTERLVGRFLLALPLIAVVGALVHVIPFGLRNDGINTVGGRFNLWLLPSLAYGWCAVLDRLLAALPRGVRGVGSWAVAAGSVAVLVVGGFPPGPPAPFGGASTAAAFVESQLGPGDRVILVSGATYSYAVGSDLPFRLVATPDLAVAYLPVADDERFLSIGVWALEPDAVEGTPALVEDADRVFVVSQGPLVGYVPVVETYLTEAGFQMAARTRFEWATVDEWVRSAPQSG